MDYMIIVVGRNGAIVENRTPDPAMAHKSYKQACGEVESVLTVTLLNREPKRGASWELMKFSVL